MTIMEDYFNFRGYKYLRLDGMTKADDRGELLALFNDPTSEYFIFLLSTRAGGLGLNLQSADTVIIFDSDWNPHQDLQAQDRAHRIGQKNEVRVLRLMSVNTVEERILAAARYKLNMDEKVIQAGMFDQKSTGSDRRQFLQAILSNDEEDEEEADVPDEETINQMLARNEEEFEKFQNLDLMRKADEGDVVRLMQEQELPDWMLKEGEESEGDEDEGEEELGDRRARSKKEVDYTESLTEREWLRAIGANMEEEGGGGEEDDEELRSGRLGRRSTGKVGQSSSKGRRKKREETEEEEVKPRKRGRPARDKSSQPSRKRGPQRFLKKLINGLIRYTNNEGRVLSEPFMKLPSRRVLADYYEVIKFPMDIHKILGRIEDGRYEALGDMESDFMLLCRNAQEYNEETSIIYEDSVVLQSVFSEMKERIQAEMDAAQDEGDDASNQGDESDEEPVAKKKRGPKPGGGRGRRKRIKYADDTDEDDDDNQDDD